MDESENGCAMRCAKRQKKNPGSLVSAEKSDRLFSQPLWGELLGFLASIDLLSELVHASLTVTVQVWLPETNL